MLKTTAGLLTLFLLTSSAANAAVFIVEYYEPSDIYRMIGASDVSYGGNLYDVSFSTTCDGLPGGCTFDFGESSAQVAAQALAEQVLPLFEGNTTIDFVNSGCGPTTCVLSVPYAEHPTNSYFVDAHSATLHQGAIYQGPLSCRKVSNAGCGPGKMTRWVLTGPVPVDAEVPISPAVGWVSAAFMGWI